MQLKDIIFLYMDRNIILQRGVNHAIIIIFKLLSSFKHQLSLLSLKFFKNLDQKFNSRY